jgi:hypothetical protein
VGTVDHWIYGERHPFGSFTIPDLTPSRELSYVLGAFLGDGCAFKTRSIKGTILYEVQLAVRDRDFANEFNKCISKILRKDGGYSIFERGGYYAVRVTNRILYEFLKKPWKMHKQIIEKFPAEFLRGFFDSEGCVHRRMIAVSNTNLGLIKYIKSLLKRHFSITTAPKIYSESYVTQKGLRKCYRLEINRKESRLRFYRFIGFSIARKQETLRKMLEKLSAYGKLQDRA